MKYHVKHLDSKNSELQLSVRNSEQGCGCKSKVMNRGKLPFSRANYGSILLSISCSQQVRTVSIMTQKNIHYNVTNLSFPLQNLKLHLKKNDT